MGLMLPAEVHRNGPILALKLHGCNRVAFIHRCVCVAGLGADRGRELRQSSQQSSSPRASSGRLAGLRLRAIEIGNLEARIEMQEAALEQRQEGRQTGWREVPCNRNTFAARVVTVGQETRLVDLLARTAARKKATPAQIALAWLLAQNPWIVPIPGATKLHRLEENLGAVDIELTPVDLREIDCAASKIAVQGARYSEQQERQTGR
jgi:hypothetical protein